MTNQEQWLVKIHKQVQKSFGSLPEMVRSQMAALLLEIRFKGPVRGNWKNYSKLGKYEHHCHLKSGHPTYVCCWRMMPVSKVVEIYYVGTHENAPY